MIYLDNAATSHPKPKAVNRCVQNALRKYGNPGRSGHRLSVEAEEKIYATREAVCSFFHAGQPERVIFTLNATHALNLALGVLYRRGDHILISDLEHNAVLRAVYQLYQRGEVTYGIFSHKGDVIENLRQARREQTRIVMCCEASNVSGHAMPIKEIGDYCRENGMHLIVDGAQGAGHLHTDLSKMHCSAYCASGHKGLLGMQGCGFCLFGTDRFERDFICGGTGSESFLPHMPESLPDRFEAGTCATPAILSLEAGISALRKNAQKHVAMVQLTARLYDGLSGIRGLHIVSERDNQCGIVSFYAEGAKHLQLCNGLQSRGFCLRSGYHCAPLAHKTLHTDAQGCLRASLGIYSKPWEVERLLKETERLLRSAQ